MKVLMMLHHPLDPNLGAPGATLALGKALEQAGCQVRYFGFEEAFPGRSAEGVGAMLRFPWKAASFLARHAGDFDAIDASTGDGWVWARRGRPGARPRHALLTRSHGLEYLLDRQVRAAHREGRRYSWKYPLYHGGLRLWEVTQSLRAADRCILLNDEDRAVALTCAGVPAERLSVIPHGIAEHFHALPPPAAVAGPLRLAFVGTWIERKGIGALTHAVERLHQQGLDFEIGLFGTGRDEATVRAAFSAAAQPHLHVVPGFRHEDLPGLLAGSEVVLFPSLAEGFGLALVEAMACGLTPVSTPVGVAPAVIVPGESGLIVPLDQADALSEAVIRLARDRPTLLQMRRHAQEAAGAYRWSRAAAETIAVYEQALAGKPPRNVL